MRLLLAVALGLACSPAREALLAVTPSVPQAAGCDSGSTCHGAVPVVCSASGRWWPATPAGAPCPHGCVVDDAGARCRAPAEDGGAP